MIGLALLVPVVLALIFGTGEPSTFWSNLIVITGAQVAATLVAAVLFASRLSTLTGKLGISTTMWNHRLLGTSAGALTLLHLIAVVADEPRNVWLVDAFQAPARAIAGTLALITLISIIVSANRHHTGRNYERWRKAHRIGAVLVLGLASWHIIGLNQLINDVPWLLFFLLLGLTPLVLAVKRWRGQKFLVGDIYSETPTVSTVTLRPINNPLTFRPGQFVWIRLHAFPWSEDHPFTISSATGLPYFQITFRHNGDWTQGPLAALRPGRHVWIDGPHGALLPSSPSTAGLVMIAAGVGLTPVMSILRSWPDMETQLIIPPNEPLFREELSSLGAKIHPVLLRPFNAEMITRSIPDPQQWTYLLCGPPSLVSDARAALTQLNVPDEQVLTEEFQIV